ncbi:alpha/beta hydrolase [Antrihabitans sp. YC2-6]|uniref:alpha/beta hydrolase n=1 Tax=Antrihabitans sp. YC2-6 TaxID=2799498 RepID=UPI0018F679AD|nr:alpha/beta hydrolase fold domain-containing protein [Antrihabitans sp. YC2-6]MBJ8345420.1 alpha/beta hydrolase fold domain-containing protein [Antrihabitans sp. YC2-6]
MVASRSKRPSQVRQALRGHGLAQNSLVRNEFAGTSLQARALDIGLRATVKPAINIWALAPSLPWPYKVVDHVGRALRSVPGTKRRQITLPNCRAEITTPANVRGDRYMIYMHGGAFIVGGRHLHSQLISRLARDLSTEVIGVDYRMLPKFSIDDGVADCLDAYRHALAEGVPAEQIVFAGDSAGAYLVFMTAIVAGEQGLPMPGAIVSISPPTEFELGTKLGAAASDALFSKYFARKFMGFVAAQPVVPRSLVGANCAGLPPSLIQVSSNEILYADAERFAGELGRAGVSCELQVWHGQVHVFQAAASIVPEAAHALSEVVGFVDRTLAANSAARTA